MDQYLLHSEFAIVDVETTGFSHDRDNIIEIASVVVGKGFKVVSEFSALVKVDVPIPDRIVELTGITSVACATHGVGLARAMRAFHQHVGDLPLFAHNALFDMRFIQAEAGRCGLVVANPFYCTLKLAKEALPGLDSYRLERLAEHLGVARAAGHTAHRALADVMTTLGVLRATYKALGGAQAR